MKTTIKRILSLFLVLVMLGSMLPAVYAESEGAEPVVLTDEDYTIVDDVFRQIDEMEDAPAKKSATRTQITDAAAEIVMASENYVEGSLERNGNSFTWWTDEGIRCIYNPYMREKYARMEAPADPELAGIYNEPVATKGGWPSGKQVYLIGPYYGIDDSFEDQYKNEARSIATAIGDTDGYTLYSGSAATIDKVADAIENGAVVIFDSHGTTDYDGNYVCDDPDGYEVYDYVSKAKYSYLCLTSKTGLTTADYNAGATYFTDSAGDMCVCINGAAIANHMEGNSPAGILWMAICLGMATNTLCEPMRAKGVEVVYGYSQSVTFAGDYLLKDVFWDNMIAGKDVATSISAMKSKWGKWDWSDEIAGYYGYSGYSTIANARKYRASFPIVVSDEDTHPGQRGSGTNYGACSEQTVKSTYTLFSQYSVTARSNNTAWGTVSASGNTITAKPASGYFAQGYTVVSGNATVSQNGNTFTVNASSDCVVQINFAAKTAVTVNFSGANVSAKTGYAGDSMELPAVTAPEGYKFLGWMTAPLRADTTEKPTYYTDSFVPTGNTTLYALYSYVDENSGTGTGDYVKVTSTPDDWSGEYVIVYEAAGHIFDGSLTSFDAVSNYKAVTITDNTIAAADADPYKFTIEAMNGGYSIRGTSGGYIGQSSNANGLITGSSALRNTISLEASGNANIISAGGAYLRYNTTSGQNRFRYYKSTTFSSQKAIALYVKDGSAGTTYYTTSLCDHASTSKVAAVAATCTEAGYTAGVQCDDCGSFVSGRQVIPALGHSYNAVVTAPTATQQGYTTYTCSACGDSYVGDYVDALGETFTVSFVVPGGVATIADMSCGKAGITLPEAGIPSGEYAYKFAGWATAEVNNSSEAPEIYTGTYKATEDTTLYALYTYSVGGSGNTEYVLTDIADISDTDSVVITVTCADGTVYALSSANGTAKAPTAVIVEADGDVLTDEPADALQWNIGGSKDAYILYPAGTTTSWLYCTNTNNGVRVGTAAGTFKIDKATGYLYNNNTGRYLGVYRTNPDWRCYTNTTGNTANQTLGFYVKGEGGTTYYTTVIADPCSHEDTTTTTVNATCTEDGSTSVVCNDCGSTLSNQVIPATGHNYTLSGNTYTCAGCGDSYNIFYVSFSVPAGVSAVGKIEYTAGGITLPSAGVPSGEHTYTFVGWSEKGVEDTTEKPIIYPAGSTYETDKAMTLQAVYAYVIADDNSGSGDYVKVTEEPTDWSGEYLIVYEADKTEAYVYNGSLNSEDTLSKANNYIITDLHNGTISAADGDPFRFIIAAEGNAYTIKSVSGMYIGRNTSANGLNASSSTVYTNTLALDSSGHVRITSQAGTYLKFNNTNTGSYMFRYYKSGQKDIALYQKSGSNKTTYYTTVIGEEKLVEAWNICLGDNIGVNFVMNVAAADEVSFVVAGSAVEAVRNGNTYSIYLAAAQMMDEIVISVDGEVLEETYSVRKYADAILADAAYSGAHALVKAMLGYGGAAQTAFGYNTGALASSGIAAGTAVPTGETAVAVTDDLAGLDFYGASLVHKNRTAVRFYFTGDVSGLTFSRGTLVQKGDMYYIEVADINPQSIGDTIDIVVSDGTHSLTVGYSPLTYIVRMYERADSTHTTKALVQAMYNYYLAAADYAN